MHGTGCGLAAKGEGFETLMRTQWGYAVNPNVGAILMVGLGCEVFQIARMKEEHRIVEGEAFQSLTIQATGGTRKTVEAGVARVREMLPALNCARRAPQPASALTLALQCGGSDGYSGITANPALGAAVDILVRNGGTAILSETPEIYGAEHLLTRRAATPRDRPRASRAHPLVGGLLRPQRRRDEQQSLARQQGRRPDDHPREVARRRGQGRHDGAARGLQIRRAGHDEGLRLHGHAGLRPVSATGQVAGGANVIAFTTGRGSAFGCKPAPSIKLATNTDIYRRMTEDMDINCGDVLDGVSVADKGREIFDQVLKVASGERTKSEALGYGEAEFTPWQIGATM